MPAARMIRHICDAIRSLARHPLQGRVVPECDDPILRELIIALYRVVYRYSAGRDLVQVVGIHHGAQRMPATPPDA